MTMSRVGTICTEQFAGFKTFPPEWLDCGIP
jgi:hypothetical protein